MDVEGSVKATLAKQNGHCVAVRFTPDGEIRIMRKDGKDVEEPLQFPTAALVPKMRDHHKDAMGIIYTAVQQINEKKRLVPLTRNEAIEFGIKKQTIAELERFGLVQQRILRLNNLTTKKPIGGRAVVYFTPQGRSFVRAVFDPEYGVHKDGESSTGEDPRNSGTGDVQVCGAGGKPDAEGGVSADGRGPDGGSPQE